MTLWYRLSGVTSSIHVYLPRRFPLQTLEKIKGAIQNGQSRDTSNIQFTRHRTRTNKTNTNNVNKTGDLQQTTGGKEEYIIR